MEKATEKVVSPEKLKDMIESILPAAGHARKMAYAAKRRECRRVRRKARQYLRSCDDDGYTDKDLFLKPFQTQNVWRRRGADKLNHFERWATRLTLNMTEQEALDYIRRLLPRNLIGDHAFSHWESYVKYKYTTSAALKKPRKYKRKEEEEQASPAPKVSPKKPATSIYAPHLISRLAHRVSRYCVTSFWLCNPFC